MKKTLLTILAAVSVLTATALPKALYVKQGENYTKYNFGVAGNLHFSDGGKTLTITGYSEAIDLDAIDYISFSAPVQDALSPSQQKAKMITIGEEINKRVDLYNVQDAILMFECFTRSDRSNDWTGYSEYKVPQEYWDVHHEFGANAMKAACGDIAAIAKVRAGAANIYKFEDYTGIYNANSETQTWEKISEAGYFEMRFRADDGDNYVVRLTPSKDFTSYSTTDYKGQLPRRIDILLAKGNTTIASGHLDTELVQDKKITFDTEITCGKYNVKENLVIINDKISSKLNVTVAGEKFATADREVSGKNLLVYDEMYDAIHEASHWHNENGDCMGEDYEALTAHFIRATADVDVLGLLQAKARAFGFNKIYNHFKDMDDHPYDRLYKGENKYIYTEGKILSANSDNSIIELTGYDVNFFNEMEQYLNNYVDATFYYDNKTQLQGYLSFETVEEISNYECWYDSYYSEPTTGFTKVDDYLVDVRRDVISQTWTENGYVYEYGPWYYTLNDSDNWENDQEIEVPASQVIFPKLFSNRYYEVTPVLTFPDLTSFAFEDFFDETTFKKLIDDYEDIISTYDTIVGRQSNEY